MGAPSGNGDYSEPGTGAESSWIGRWRDGKDGCVAGAVALALVIIVVGLVIWRVVGKPAESKEEPVVVEGPDRLNNTAWFVVREREGTPEAYARALQQAEAAVQAAPQNGAYLNTLGVAQYRVGRYADALNTLTKSEKLNARNAGSLPADLAFIAMAQYRLGRKDEALATLDRLREAMKGLPTLRDRESRQFLGEAEELLRETTKDTKNTKKEG